MFAMDTTISAIPPAADPLTDDLRIRSTRDLVEEMYDCNQPFTTTIAALAHLSRLWDNEEDCKAVIQSLIDAGLILRMAAGSLPAYNEEVLIPEAYSQKPAGHSGSWIPCWGSLQTARMAAWEAMFRSALLHHYGARTPDGVTRSLSSFWKAAHSEQVVQCGSLSWVIPEHVGLAAEHRAMAQLFGVRQEPYFIVAAFGHSLDRALLNTFVELDQRTKERDERQARLDYVERLLNRGETDIVKIRAALTSDPVPSSSDRW